MLHGLFITGTGTNVGKTVTAAALMHRCRGLADLRYWKPIQTGIEQDDDTATVRSLGTCHERELWTPGVRLARPVSPHLAAAWSGVRIDIAELRNCIAEAPPSCRWVIEGAGGVLVPLNERALMIDFIVHLSLPVLIVASSTVGTINHTLLTIEALRKRSIEIGGVVMVGERNQDNREAIERFGSVDVLGQMPIFPKLSAEALAAWALSELDLEGRLFRHWAR